MRAVMALSPAFSFFLIRMWPATTTGRMRSGHHCGHFVLPFQLNLLPCEGRPTGGLLDPTPFLESSWEAYGVTPS